MSHPAFTLWRQTPIPSLNITLEEYRHLATGARHFHLCNPQDNNRVFLVGFLTVSENSTGVAHVLEHTVLCGSERFPVHDPFFAMTRRSLNTFMNAITSSDWTAYPFASQNIKDFENLLQVYLDAVFFPRLDALDFAQEGHRVEFTTPDNPHSPLIYKGVVYNEMKGAMSSPVQKLIVDLQSYLFPTITYHHNFGGDPACIPQLTHADLKNFHATHYHPSNAIFMTYGDLPASVDQAFIQEYALQHFQAISTAHLQIPDEQRYSTPISVATTYATDDPDIKGKTHIVLAWLLAKNIDIYEVMKANLLAGVLLDNSASPLRYALETTELGTAPSTLCGLDDETREMTFACGLQGSNPEDADAVEALILNVLQQVATEGVPLAHVESVLHQMELNQREISGDGFPFGLSLMLQMLPSALHGGDPVSALDIDPLLARLRQDIQQADFIPQLINEQLLNNPHRVRLVMSPDLQLGERQAAMEQATLQARQQQLTAAEKQAIIEQTQALHAKQQQKEDIGILPKVGIADIPAKLNTLVGETLQVNNLPLTWFARQTNGMVYQTLIVEMPHLTDELLNLLPLFCDVLTQIGCNGDDYLRVMARQAAVTGGIGAGLSLRNHIHDTQTGKLFFSLSGKALERHSQELSALLRDTLHTARFDEFDRLRELIAQRLADTEESLLEHAHQLVLTNCQSGANSVAALRNQWAGFNSIKQLRELDEGIQKASACQKLAAQLAQLQSALCQGAHQFLLIGEDVQKVRYVNELNDIWVNTETGGLPVAGWQLFPTNARIRQGWATSTQVNYCAHSYPVVSFAHPDAPALTVLGDFLRNGYLHHRIREQGGAYGSTANYDGELGTFRVYSYRDPRLTETLQDFAHALDWLQRTPHSYASLEEAILGVIGRIDRPGSPAGEAQRNFFHTLHGRSAENRQQFREQVLQVSIADLQRVAFMYLQPERQSVVVLTNAQALAGTEEFKGVRFNI